MSGFKYYSFDKVLSLNAVYNFILGGRGIGKTFGAKKMVIRKFFKTGEMFIYLRRYKNELSTRETFFADVDYLFPEWDFRVHGNKAQCAHIETRDDKKREWKTMGYFVALSVSQSLKGMSFPLVKTIIYDEFVIEKGMIRYITDESTVFNNFYSTVDRYKDKTRVLFLANTVSINNPYFLAWKIRPDQVDEIGRAYDGFVAFHFPNSSEFNNQVYEKRFGKFIQGTDYAQYAVESYFADGHTELVMKKPSDARYYMTLEMEQGRVSIWNYGGGNFHVQQKRPGDERIFTTVAESMGESKILLARNDKLMGAFRTAFRHGRCTFDGPETRNIFLEVFKT